MGKETQLARAEMAPVVAGDRRWAFSDVERPLYKKTIDGFGERFLPNDRSVAIGLTQWTAFATMRGKSKEKYEETRPPRYFGFIRRDLCVAGTCFVRSKRTSDVKSSGRGATA